MITDVAMSRGYQLMPHGLLIDRDLTRAEWCACGAALTKVVNRASWAIGDWLVYGAGRGDYGEYYQDARLITGRSFESLSQYARVSQSFSGADRAIGVPWSFYREALRLPERDRLHALSVAQANQWTRDGLAEFISTRDGSQPSVAKTISEVVSRGPQRVNNGGWHPAPHHRVVRCPSCGFKFEPKRRRRLKVSR